MLNPDPDYGGDLSQIQAQLQAAIASILPHLSLPAAPCHHCLVAYTDHPMPLVGELPALPGLVLFTGFTHPWVYVPPLAQRLASSLTGAIDPVITTLSRQLAVRVIPKSAPESIG